RQYSIVKDHRLLQQSANSHRVCELLMVGLGGIEPPTSPLSGVRSSHLSYRPETRASSSFGGAGRDRTGDLLNANQALSQLSYSPKINRGQLDAGTTGPAHGHLEKTPSSKWRSQSGLTRSAEALPVVWSGTAVSYLLASYTQRRLAFRNSTHG